jgi:hypothetical protein
MCTGELVRARFRNLSFPRATAALLAGYGRQIARALRNRRIAETLSWIVWLLAVAMFAAWTLNSYRAPAAPAWLGMTLRTAVFAIWTLVAREWFALWLARRSDRRPGRSREDQRIGDD